MPGRWLAICLAAPLLIAAGCTIVSTPQREPERIFIACADPVCLKCQGSGWASCGECGGTGIVDCPRCIQGRVPCPRCRGNGTWAGQVCAVCKGQGEVLCPVCRGERQFTCGRCLGTGLVRCGEWREAEQLKRVPALPPEN